MLATAIVVIVALTIGNFSYEALRNHRGNENWGRALERSYFQAIAIVTFLLVIFSIRGLPDLVELI